MSSRKRRANPEKLKNRLNRRIERAKRREFPDYVPTESPIQLAEVVRISRMIDRSGLVANVEKILVPNPELGGRPRTLAIRTYLIVMFLHATGNRRLTGTQAFDVATRDLPGFIQVELGIRDRRGRILVTLRMFRHVLCALHQRLTTQTVGDAHEKERRDQTLLSLTQSIVAASIPRNVAWSTTQSLDATSVHSFGRARKDTTKRADKDARWGVCTRMGQFKAEDRTQFFYGYDLHITAATRGLGGLREDQPELITGMNLVPAATDVVEATMPLVRNQHEAMGEAFNEIIVDRAYSNKLPDRWINELERMGICQVADLHPNDHGAKDHDGIQIIAGCAHCPFTPEHLASIPRPMAKGQQKISPAEQAQFESLIEQRERYSLRLVANGNGKERRQCPAVAGKLRCTSRPETLDVGDDLPLVEGPTDLATAPKVCKQETVTVPHSALGKLRQPHYWGSHTWIVSFNRRSTVERKNSDLKQPVTNNLQRGAWQVMGRVKNSIMVTLCVVANNLRLARNWAARNGKTHLDPDLLTPDPEYIPNLNAPPGYRGLPPPSQT